MTDDLHFLAHLDDAALDPARHHRAAARDREHVLHRHQERQVHRTLRLRDIGVHLRHQLQDRVLADHRVAAFHRRQGRALDDRNVVARELVAGQKLANLHLHQLQKLGVVHHVHLVQEHHQRRNPRPDGPAGCARGSAASGRPPPTPPGSRRPSAPRPVIMFFT